MNPDTSTRKRIVAYASSHLSVSAPTINTLDNLGFDVRHCRSAIDTIELFKTPTADQRPTLLVSDTMLYDPNFDILDVQTVRTINEDSPGVMLFKYLRIYHRNLQAILYTHDVLEKERLANWLEDTARLQIILASAHLTQDIVRAATKEFPPVSKSKKTKARNPDDEEFLAKKAVTRRNMVLAASH